MNGLPVEDDEPAWRKLKLTLERPYKDDQGNIIRQLLDVTPEGQQVYEPYARALAFLCNGYICSHLRQGSGPEQTAGRKHPPGVC